MSEARNTFVIARRELLERAKSKWFVAMTLLGPIFMVALVVVPHLLGRDAKSTIDIIDQSGKLGEPLEQVLEAAGWSVTLATTDASDDIERARIERGAINGYLRIPHDALAAGEVVYRGDNASSPEVTLLLRQAVTEVVRTQRGRDAGMSPEQLVRLLAPPSFVAQQPQGSSGMAAFVIAFSVAFALYMVITLYGVAVMRSVVQEKTSRVMELMVAAVKPRSLMAGKILGVGSAGLIQVGVWLAIGAITLTYRDELLGWFGAEPSSSQLPSFALAEVAVVAVYFVLGFFFYSAMYAAAGALVSSEQETQQVQMPVTMVMVVGLVCLQIVSNDPRGAAASTLTMVPFWSPMLMPMRFVLGGASLGDVAMSVGILAISTVFVVRIAGKIYRVGVLMYGKRPSLREAIRWLRY